MSNTKILVVYHDQTPPLIGEYFEPIKVGATEPPTEGLYDSTGDNINIKNPRYNELTAIYWAWKHYAELGDPDFLGLCHYRRYFVWEQKKYPYYECFDKNEIRSLSLSDNQNVDRFIPSSFIIAPRPTRRKSVADNYAKSHHKEDIDLLLDIITQTHPEMLSYGKEYLSQKGVYYYNMFVMPKGIFMDYASWLFDVVDKFAERCEHKNERLFISEIVTGIYLYYLKTAYKEFVELPILFWADRRPPFKKVFAETKQNFKQKKSTFLYSLKPLILWFIPRKLMLIRRRRKV